MRLAEILPSGRPSKAAEGMLEDLASTLEIPASRYESAERSFKALGDWLDREESSIAKFEVTVYPQGSFRLGTVIRPVSDEDDYDLDVVCEVRIDQNSLTQEDFKKLIGLEVMGYAKARKLEKPDESRRCWTLNYAEGAQFHMDVLPALPGSALQKRLIVEAGADRESVTTALAITDFEHKQYRIRGGEWPSSNPKGYSVWFLSRMKVAFEARRGALALLEKANVEDIPEYRVKTPLQSAIQILKRHRDIQFVDDSDAKPISIIITTLAANAYQQESTIGGALYSILARMDDYIQERNGVSWIVNPTDPRENFADKWIVFPERKKAFFDWLESARRDFFSIASMESVTDLVEALSPKMGRKVVETAAEKRRPKSALDQVIAKRSAISEAVQRIFNAAHRQKPNWPVVLRGKVEIVSATMKRHGKPLSFRSDSFPIPKGSDLFFEARTDVPEPYQVYWQIVNTGREAAARNQLRGGFDVGIIDRGRLVRKESSAYTGTHSVECFIVKDGYCIAQSGPFIVNVA